MIPVTAKFRVQRIERSVISGRTGKDEQGVDIWGKVEVATIVMTPIMGTNNPDDENSKFFAATPSGEIRLGTINAEAAAQFALDGEMYVTFTPAEIGTFQPAS